MRWTRVILILLAASVPAGAYLPRRVSTPGGVALQKWADAAFPLMWQLNTTRGANTTGARSLADVTRAGFQSWASAPTAAVSFVEGPSTPVSATRRWMA